MSRRAIVLNVAALTFFATLAVGFLWVMSSLPRIEGQMPLRGLDLPATVSRDGHGIPRITARSIHDAYFLLGWTHAQDRLWQMEVQRRVAAGRLAEMIGPAGLANDRFMRTLGLRRLAAASAEHLDKQTREALQAYADGVNTWVDDHRFRLPMEFHLLRVDPEPWTPADTLAWGRLMALQLAGNWRDDLLRAALGPGLGAARLGELFPGYPAGAPVTLSAAAAASMLAAIPSAALPHLASNTWVVSGKLTASGKPLLANDPHLALQSPVLWYLAGIEAPGLSVAGGTVPGVPFVLAGHNQRIAWGMTSTGADTVDLFVETLTPDGAAVLTPAGAKPLAVRKEMIAVRGAKPEEITVREGPNGPLVSDVLDPAQTPPGQVLAMRSTALERDDRTAGAMYRLQRAADWRGFLTALETFDAPVQNFAFADIGGDIGFATAGRVPVRKGGDGSLPMPGATGAGAWSGWVPPAALPHVLNPLSGVIVNANNPPAPSGGSPLLAASWPDGYRAKRIGDMLAGRKGLKPEDMAAMQMDSLSLADIEIKRLLANARPTTPLARRAAEMIAAWDGRAEAGRPEALIYNTWIRQLWHDLLAAPLGDNFAAFDLPRPAVLIGLLTRNRHWCAEAAADKPDCDALAGRSLDTAVNALAARHGEDPSAWTWGSEHRVVFENRVLARALGWMPGLSALFRHQAATDGDDFTVNRGSFGPDTFIQVHGAGMRAVYDLADLSASRFVIATGQSGNALSRHAADMLDDWLANRGHVISSATSSDNSTLSLEPGY